LLHLVGFSFTYLSKMHGHSNIKFSENSVEKMKTYILIPMIFFSENRDVYEVKWKSMVEPDRPQMAIKRMLILCWMTKATEHTHRISNTYSHCNNGCTNSLQCYIYAHIACLVSIS